MTGAVLFAAAGLEKRLEVVAGQLRSAGAETVHIVQSPREAAELVRNAGEKVLLASADLVANDAVLHILATEPGDRTYALTSADAIVQRGRVTGADEAFLGALRIAPADLAVAADCCQRAGTLDSLLAELIRAGVAVMACRVRFLHAERATAQTLEPALAAIAAVDSDQARLRYAVKEHDDAFATYCVSPYSPYLARWAARRGLSPAAVTGASVLLAGLAAAGFAVGSRPALVAGAVLLYLGFVLDCVDGQLARYTRRFSAFGGWLDTMADRAKEYLVYAGLAAATGAWKLAVAAMVLQTVRHMTDTWYGRLHDRAVVVIPHQRGGRLGQLSDRVLADKGSAVYWLKRTVVFPIGERWAVMALAAAVFDGRVALIAVLAWGAVAAAYTLVLRTLRSWRMRVSVVSTVDLDNGVIKLPVPRGRLDWLVPAALRTVEYLVVIAVGLAAHPRLTFVLLFVLALRHYDLAARPALPRRSRANGGGSIFKPPPFALDRRSGGASPEGWVGRVVVLGVAAAVGLVPQVMAVLAGYLGVMLGIRSATGWDSTVDPRRAAPQLAERV